MKKLFLCLLAITPAFQSALSQITITRADMPVPGDTLRVSVTNTVPSGYARTAMDTTWDFSMLEPLAQRLDTFVTAASTPAGYQLVFVLLGGSNLASPSGGIPVPGFPVSQGYTFYRNSETAFEEMGTGYTIQNFPLPAKYDVPEKIYQFPAHPGDTWSSVSNFSISLPSMGFYGTMRQRSSAVDGWGTLITPFGTFQTLRVRSEVILHDSVYLDSLGNGFTINRFITEYRWLANGKGIPVLQVNEENGVVTAIYRDIFRTQIQLLSVNLGPDTTVLKGTELTLHATVTGGVPPYQVLWSTMDTGSTVTLTVTKDQVVSALVFDALQNFGGDQVVITVRYAPGFEDKDQHDIHLRPLPARGHVTVDLPPGFPTAEFQILSPEGKVLGSGKVAAGTDGCMINLQGIPPGLYMLRISTGNRTWTAKLPISN
ncbi:MAG TPA: hypothetical protein PKG48_11875 [Bacteroidales bacterium]|nr:hypothetical protein [Bacteroidales bacterium]